MILSLKIIFESVAIFSLVCLLGCAGDPIFRPIPLSTTSPTLAKPISMPINESTKRAYLINSNYTVNYENASLLVLDLTDPLRPTVLRTLALQNFSGEALLDTSGKNLYVTNRLSQDVKDVADHLFQINIDETSGNFLALQEFNTDSNPFGLVSDGTHLFIVNESSLDSYLLSDLTHRTRVDFNIKTTANNTINTQNTRTLTLSPSGNFIFVTNQGGRVLILDVSQISAPDSSTDLTLGGSEAVDYVLSDTFSTSTAAQDADYIYLVEASPPALKILSDKDLPVVSGNPQEILIASLGVAEIPLGNNPGGIVVDSIPHRVYVANTQDHTVSVIDTQLFVEIARISVNSDLAAGISAGEAPFALSLGHFGGVPYIYVLNLNTNNISIINGNTLAVVGSFP